MWAGPRQEGTVAWYLGKVILEGLEVKCHKEINLKSHGLDVDDRKVRKQDGRTTDDRR